MLPSTHRATFDELLAPLAGDDASAPTGTLVRASASYATRDERFLIKHKDYDRQYAQLYFYRLLQMRAHVEAAARSAWPGIPGAAREGVWGVAGRVNGVALSRGVPRQTSCLISLAWLLPALPACSGAHPVGARGWRGGGGGHAVQGDVTEAVHPG